MSVPPRGKIALCCYKCVKKEMEKEKEILELNQNENTRKHQEHMENPSY